MDKTKLIATSLPWALIAAILAAFGAPPPIIAFAQTIHSFLPQIIEIGGTVGTAAVAAITGYRALRKPPV